MAQKHTFFFFLFYLSQSVFSQPISIDTNYTANQLVEDVVIGGPCATITNPSITGYAFSDGAKSYGYFNANGSDFPFQQGIILTTGKASDASKPVQSTASNSGPLYGWGGHYALDQALQILSKEATALSFDFTATTNKINFRYIFASEEYKLNSDYACKYSDGFAFLLTEASDVTNSYINLAVVPGTDTPVKVTTVRPLIIANDEMDICEAKNEEFFDKFNDYSSPTVYDGQTKVPTAEANVKPGTRYRIILVIADENDSVLDSAVFIEGGSFSSVIDEEVSFCRDSTVILDAGDYTSYTWDTDPIQTTKTIVVNQGGAYNASVLDANGCKTIKKFKVLATEKPIIEKIETDDSSENNATIIASGIGNYTYSVGGVNYQTSNFFKNLSVGEYMAYVKDENCGISSKSFYIINYPKFFTPNNDGFNDVWEIKNLTRTSFEGSTIEIFDRFGKLIKIFKSEDDSWDGTYNSIKMPSADYWFVIKPKSGDPITSHFTLKR